MTSNSTQVDTASKETGTVQSTMAESHVPGRPKLRLAVSEVMRRYGILVVWGLLIVVFSILRPSEFPTLANATNIAGSQAILVILALAVLAPFIVGEFDLAISGVASIALVLVGWLNVVHHWPIGFAIAVALGVGAGIGLVNAFFVVVLGVESIVVTLGMATLLQGLGTRINNATTAGISAGLVNSIHHTVGDFPLAFYYVIGLTVAIWYVLTYTPLGRHLYFVGAGREAARLAGLRVDMLRAGALVASGVISALGGVVLAGWLGASDPNVASSFLLPVFSATFLGASFIKPGRFNPWGSVGAVYFLVTGITGLEMLGLTGWIENVFYGGALILAVAFSRVAARGAFRMVRR